MKSKWEFIDKCNGGVIGTERMKVVGGWIVISSRERTVHQLFIADPDHLWIIENEPSKDT